MSTNIKRIWQPVKFEDEWINCDTSGIDDIIPSWLERRQILKENSKEYSEFIEKLKREHAIETGIVERLYDLDRGVTETLIEKGFIESLVSHQDATIPKKQLFGYLTDHMEGFDFIFDVVNNTRELTVGFIKELHALVTRSQETTTAVDQFENIVEVQLIKGDFKKLENNPTRNDGTKIYYCPPGHVESEMDQLIELYNSHVEKKIHPVILAAWFHHKFSVIHPFHDGNGRIARYIASLILIKYNLFPFTVGRAESKTRYIEALESADSGSPQALVDYFSDSQKKNIEKALNLREVSSTTLSDIGSMFSKKVTDFTQKLEAERNKTLTQNRSILYSNARHHISSEIDKLRQQVNGSATFTIDYCAPDDERGHYYYGQIISYAKKHNYYFNRSLPKAWITVKVSITPVKVYQIGFSIHHYGYDDSTIAIGAFLEYLGNSNEQESNDRTNTALPLDIPPHVISILNDIGETKEKNIKNFLDNALSSALAHIISEL